MRPAPYTFWMTFGVCALILSVLTTTRQADTKPPESVQIEYEGRLLDDKRKPIAGVFPMEFFLYKDKGDDKPLWRESHWVAVQSGKYTVRLGSNSRIRANLAGDSRALYLGVNLRDIGELTRESVTLPLPGGVAEKTDKKPDDAPKQDAADKASAATDKAQDKASPAKTAAKASDKRAGNDKGQFKTEASFAEVAEYAQRAKVAENAEKVGGKTVEELEAEIEKLRELIAELRTNQKGAQVTIGDDSTVLPRVGGTGGSAYLRECPPGYVVTGIRGSAGALIDGLQLICSPLR